MTIDLLTPGAVIYSGQPGAGDWTLDCRLSGLASTEETITWLIIINDAVYLGSPQVFTKATDVTTFQYPIPIHCNASETVTVSVYSSEGDLSVTASAVLTSYPSSTQLLSSVIDGTITWHQVLYVMLATAAGKVAVTEDGSGIYTATFKRIDGETDALQIFYEPVQGERATTGVIT